SGLVKILTNAKIVQADRALYDLAHSISAFIVNNHQSMVLVKDGKVSIRCGKNFYYKDKVFAKTDESFFKCYNKIADKCAEHGLILPKLEDMPYFKAFSSNNVGGNDFKLVFSSDGERGAWDIATMSMRGINSCQGWGKPQSHGLIGSIS